MTTILFATGNAGKIREIREILNDPGIRVYSLKEAGVEAEIEENGTTFEENALLKAQQVADWCRTHELPDLPDCNGKELTVLADDSGLVIDYLGGEPGIYSARYMGRETSYREKNANLISRLEGVPKAERTARFACAIAAVFPDGSHAVTTGTVEGYIGWQESGENGFGYDPIFYLFENDRSTASLPMDEKNAISHRGRALRKMREILEEKGRQR